MVSAPVISALMLSSLFIVIDTQMIMTKLNTDEYVVGAIRLYLDILNLFLKILRILAALKKKDNKKKE